jgi:hypothetical protein
VTKQWSTLNLSEAKAYFAGASIGTKAFFAGGLSEGLSVSRKVDIYDAAQGLWGFRQLSVERMQVVGVSSGAKAFFAGGSIPNIDSFTNRVDIYDAKTGQWRVDSLKWGRVDFAAVAIGNKVVFAGGKGNNWGLKSIEVYDTETNTWDSTNVQSTEEMPSGAGASAGDKLLISGGYIVDMFQLK